VRLVRVPHVRGGRVNRQPPCPGWSDGGRRTRPLEHLATLLVAAAAVAASIRQIKYVHERHVYANDFLGTIWRPARAVLHGETPYPVSDLHSVYPPAVFLVASPLGLLPRLGAIIIWQTVLVAAVVATLWLLGVRDWRCYAVTLVSCPVIIGALWGNLSLLLMFACAIVWRFRDRPLANGAAVAGAVVAKLFLAPLWFWLMFTQRRRSAAVCLAAVPFALIVSWAAIGFEGFLHYPARLAADARAAGPLGVLVQALVRQLHGTPAEALVCGAAAAAGLVLFAWRARDDDAVCFTYCLAAALLLSPISWIYYLSLLVVPLAIQRPRLSIEWWLLVLLWAHDWSGDVRRIASSVGAIALSGAIVFMLTRGQGRATDGYREGGVSLSMPTPRRA
jgi:hypothetical protein